MQHLDKKSIERLNQRLLNHSLRTLGEANNLVDFSSNDYIGFSKNESIYNQALQLLESENCKHNGATGSRLISGNHKIYKLTEEYIAQFHSVEKALIFNSGYSANVGLLTAVAQRNNLIFYDELCHASIREGISLSHAKAYKFKHNDLTNLEEKLSHVKPETTVYVITETVFSMDGDSPDIQSLIKLTKKYRCRLILDEAHALGVFGDKGCGLINNSNSKAVFARIVTFGKSLGCHGSAVLGSQELIQFLINFSKPFIYTTGLSPHAVATIYCAYKTLENSIEIEQLKHIISYFNFEIERLELEELVIKSKSAIQCVVIKGNAKTKLTAQILQQKQFNVKAILSPTVAKGQERLRFCLHSYNSEKEITAVLDCLKTIVIP